MTAIVAVTGDQHCNSTVGLCPPAVTLDDGGTYRASKAQGWLWTNWLDYWKQVKALRKARSKKKKKLYLVFNGDLVEGEHHDTPQIITKNIETQHRIALACLEPALDLKPDYIFIVRGTEVHTGKSAQHEEALARDIGAEPDTDTGADSWWWLPLAVENILFDIAHKGRTGHRPWTEANAANLLAAQLVFEYAERGDRMPDLALRNHVHKKNDTFDNFPIRVVYCPSFQLSTGFGHSIAPGKLLPIGGLAITCDRGEYDVKKMIYNPPRRKPWRADD